MEDTEGFSLVILAGPLSEQILAQGSNSWPPSVIQPASPPTTDLIKFISWQALKGEPL